MALEEKELELIEQYLDGKLKGADLELFDEKLQTDHQFALEVTGYRNTIESIDAYGRDLFSESIAGWEEELEESAKEKEVKIVPFKRYVAIAATLLLLLIPAAYLIFFYQSQESRLFAQHFQPYENITNVRSDDRSNELLQQGMTAYDSKAYRQAIELLNEYVHANQSDATAIFYLGEAYLANDQPEQAETQYLAVVENGDNVFVEIAQWHLALTYLKQDKTEQLQELLQSIKGAPGHTYSQEAEELVTKYFNSH